jgi:hypothetical protein
MPILALPAARSSFSDGSGRRGGAPSSGYGGGGGSQRAPPFGPWRRRPVHGACATGGVGSSIRWRAARDRSSRPRAGKLSGHRRRHPQPPAWLQAASSSGRRWLVALEEAAGNGRHTITDFGRWLASGLGRTRKRPPFRPCLAKVYQRIY